MGSDNMTRNYNIIANRVKNGTGWSHLKIAMQTKAEILLNTNTNYNP